MTDLKKTSSPPKSPRSLAHSSRAEGSASSSTGKAAVGAGKATSEPDLKDAFGELKVGSLRGASLSNAQLSALAHPDDAKKVQEPREQTSPSSLSLLDCLEPEQLAAMPLIPAQLVGFLWRRTGSHKAAQNLPLMRQAQSWADEALDHPNSASHAHALKTTMSNMPLFAQRYSCIETLELCHRVATQAIKDLAPWYIDQNGRPEHNHVNTEEMSAACRPILEGLIETLGTLVNAMCQLCYMLHIATLPEEFDEDKAFVVNATPAIPNYEPALTEKINEDNWRQIRDVVQPKVLAALRKFCNLTQDQVEPTAVAEELIRTTDGFESIFSKIFVRHSAITMELLKECGKAQLTNDIEFRDIQDALMESMIAFLTVQALPILKNAVLGSDSIIFGQNESRRAALVRGLASLIRDKVWHAGPLVDFAEALLAETFGSESIEAREIAHGLVMVLIDAVETPILSSEAERARTLIDKTLEEHPELLNSAEDLNYLGVYSIQ